MEKTKGTVDANTLRTWLENNERVFVLDIRPSTQREEWQIPGSHYLNAYDRLNEGDYSVLNAVEIPENAKVVTVCAAGKTSQIASDALKEKGIDAYSLEGGMKAWSTAWNVAQKQFKDFEILQLRRTGKGCLSYIISSNREAVIIDASLPVDVYVHWVSKLGLSVKYVIETHIHADHLSRSKEVASYFQAPLYLPVPNNVQFHFNKITADTTFNFGAITLLSVPTPGHTLESYTFYIENTALFTGDTMFTNGIGRPDLKANPEETRYKAALLFKSLNNLISLPDEVIIFPAHTNKPVDFNGQMLSVTIGQAKKDIPALHNKKEDFINLVLEKIPPFPANYLAIVEKNLGGNFSDNDSTELEAGPNRCAIS
jgi:glyoxylase-like metal-dependent hydrolase (beta-lactamase superfamily II)